MYKTKFIFKKYYPQSSMHVNKKYKNQIRSTEAILFVLQKYFHSWNHKLQSSLVHYLFLLYSYEVQSFQCKGNSLCTHTIGGKFTAENMHSDYYYPVALYIITDLHCISKGYYNKKACSQYASLNTPGLLEQP